MQRNALDSEKKSPTSDEGRVSRFWLAPVSCLSLEGMLDH